uniref:Uncharacterized protein n=1 Tax=Candidatus Kentrum sp. FW TaxID=2126338 RepID=A0A450SNW8_9GAMM|nr:MAG: hypothetical protein BECKFW1821A_GA0114235_10548 [Candidatus Kentron sp. FW]VFJ69981.1 MAG: hypothetical protein BECKFW1821B_GA0114236_11764 [Candidatus Kentron sp. FW]
MGVRSFLFPPSLIPNAFVGGIPISTGNRIADCHTRSHQGRRLRFLPCLLFSELLFPDMVPDRGEYEPLPRYVVLEQCGVSVNMSEHRLVPIKYMDAESGGKGKGKTCPHYRHYRIWIRVFSGVIVAADCPRSPIHRAFNFSKPGKCSKSPWASILSTFPARWQW